MMTFLCTKFNVPKCTYPRQTTLSFGGFIGHKGCTHSLFGPIIFIPMQFYGKIGQIIGCFGGGALGFVWEIPDPLQQYESLFFV